MTRVLAWAAVAFGLLGATGSALSGSVVEVLSTIGTLSFPLVALVILRREPRNAVARTFVAAGFLLGLERASQEWATYGAARGWSEPTLHRVVWPSAWAWLPGLFLLITVALLQFPDGRLPGRGWWWAERVAVVSMAVWTIGIGTASLGVTAGELMSDGTPHPRGVFGPLFVLGEAMFLPVGVCAFVALASLFVRYRRSAEVQREQIRWVLYAAALAVVAEITVDLIGTFTTGTPGWVQSIGEGLGFLLIAVAVAVAITRYRLYEIDRIVSRSVTYAVVLVVLAGLYVAVVVGLADLVPADLGSVWVAVATLLVSVVAVPLTRRVRSAVDHRFNRGRFDGERIVAAFAGRLRQRPDTDDVGADLLEVLARTVQPSHAAVWTVPGPARVQ